MDFEEQYKFAKDDAFLDQVLAEIKKAELKIEKLNMEIKAWHQSQQGQYFQDLYHKMTLDDWYEIKKIKSTYFRNTPTTEERKLLFVTDDEAGYIRDAVTAVSDCIKAGEEGEPRCDRDEFNYGAALHLYRENSYITAEELKSKLAELKERLEKRNLF